MRQGLVQSLTQSANAILSVVVIVIAGILVVQGDGRRFHDWYQYFGGPRAAANLAVFATRHQFYKG